MDIEKIREKLNLERVNDYHNEDNEVKGVYIGDLLSLVMAKSKKGDLWLTIQTHLNIVAVATLVELSGIIVVEGMDIEEDTIKKANEVNVPIFRTNHSAYELACQLKDLGL